MTLASFRMPFRPGKRHDLEAAYRRLLRGYPAAYRAQHGEEMLGVLMATSRPGQHRPGARASADLLWSALRIRTRMFLRGTGRPRWASALALTGVLLPLLMVVLKLTEFLYQGATSPQGFGTPLDILVGSYGSPGSFTRSFQLNSDNIALAGNITQALTAGPGPALILAVLACAGWRRTAAAFAVAVSLTYTGFAQTHGYFMLGGPRSVGVLYFYGLEALVLLAAPATPRGWRALRWRPSAALAVATGAAGVSASGGLWPLLPHTTITPLSRAWRLNQHRFRVAGGMSGFVNRA